ncbi:MAG: fumarate hydratase [Acidiferrobacteraceae bacterium]|nr:fumarate hydratase [Acidiferrobacteraceae bacterium]
MTIIKQEDFISSIADSLQYISYYHPSDFVNAMARAYEKEESEAARSAIGQILINSRMAAEGHRPMCQDTGIVVAFLKVGMDARFDAELSIQDMVDEGVRRAWTNPDNPLRASVVSPPVGARKNTKDNTPAVVHSELVTGDRVEVKIAAKGGGSENKAKFAILNPDDDVSLWVTEMVPKMGAGWCPPGILGIGIGGTPEKAFLLAKESLMSPIDIDQIIAKGAQTDIEQLRLNIYEQVNALGIGAQGLGGRTTVLDVKLLTYPTHAASLPIAMIPNCAATRHIHFSLDGTGPANFDPPPLDSWPKLDNQINTGIRKVDLDKVTRDEIKQWKSGERLLLSGKLLTGRDAAHKKISELIERQEDLPGEVNFTNRFIYYVGPVDPVGNEVVGPAGPTTATRMDKYTDTMLNHTGLLGMIGKAERGPNTIDAIQRHKSVYLIAVGGAAFLVSKAIQSAKVVAFGDLGMEAIYEFVVKDMPVTVAVDSEGESIHDTGPSVWKHNIANIRVETP